MSSGIVITFDEDTGVSREDWDEFCSAHEITYSPQTMGRNVFYNNSVEVKFGNASFTKLPVLPSGRLDFSRARPPDYAEEVSFSTYHLGPEMPRVAELARAFWRRYGGQVQADIELRHLFLGGLGETIGETRPRAVSDG